MKIIGRKGKVFREFFLLLVVLLFLLVFVIGDDDLFIETSTFEPSETSDPWSEDNFEQSFLDNPVEGFDVDPVKAIGLINENPEMLISNPALLQKFDSKIQEEINLLNDHPKAKETWLKEKFSIAMASSGTKIVGYDGTNIVTEKSNFNPETLPKIGVSYELLSDGTLNPTGKFAGVYSGKIVYNPETGTLNSDTGFIDSSDTEFSCSKAGCSLQVGEDGTVKFLEGEGEVNGIGVANLRDVTMVNGVITAIPDQVGSFVDGSELFGEGSVTYDSKEKIFEGNDLQVISTSGDKLFRGKEISFLDKDKIVVAKLIDGETRFVLGSGECLPGACIQVNPQVGRMTITAAKDSIVRIYSDGYGILNFKEVKDDSQILVEEKGVRTVLVNKRGIHPYQDLTGLKKKMSYEIETASGEIATHVNNDGVDEVCVGEKCQVCTIQKCEA